MQSPEVACSGRRTTLKPGGFLHSEDETEGVIFHHAGWMARQALRLLPWLLIGNLALMCYVVFLAETPAADSSATTAGNNSDESNRRLDAMDENVRRLRGQVDQLNTILMLRSP